MKVEFLGVWGLYRVFLLVCVVNVVMLRESV